MISKLIYWFKFIITYKNWKKLVIDRIYNKNSTTIELRNDFVVKASTDSPLSVVMDETFILERYTRFFKICKGDTVIDIGAHVGDFTIYAIIKGAKKVFAFEPDPTSFSDLKNNIHLNSISNAILKKIAVSNKNGYAKFYVNSINGGNSLIHFNSNSNSIKVKTISIDDIFKECKIKNIDFLKIDCEGGEGLILDNPKINTWKSINKIALEYHDNASVLNHKKNY
jgi:FkbM family methyltransferase